MADQVKWIIGVVLAVLLFVGGYAFGARKVGSLEEQIEALRLKGQDADTVRKNSQAAIDKALKTQGDEHAKQLETLKADAERSRKELAAALAEANEHNAELQKQRRANAARTARRSPTGGGAQVASNATLAARMDPNACLALAVPKPVIVPLIK